MVTRYGGAFDDDLSGQDGGGLTKLLQSPYPQRVENVVMSPDGTKVAYWTWTFPGIPNQQAFVLDLTTGQTTRVSTGVVEGYAIAGGREVVFSADSSQVMFKALADEDNPNSAQTVIRDLATGALTMVSDSVTNQRSISGATSPGAFLPDGNHAVFVGYAAGLVPGALPSLQLMLKDLNTGGVSVISTNAEGTPIPRVEGPVAVSPSGRYVAFVASPSEASSYVGHSQGFVKDLQTGALFSLPNLIWGGHPLAFVSDDEIAPDQR